MLFTFQRDQRGVFALVWILIFIPVVSCVGLAFEMSEHFRQKTLLSNTLHQAAVALTGPNKKEGDPENKRVVENYLKAYMPGSTIVGSNLKIYVKDTHTDSMSYQIEAQVKNHSKFSFIDHFLLGQSAHSSVVGESAMAKKSIFTTTIQESMDVVLLLIF